MLVVGWAKDFWSLIYSLFFLGFAFLVWVFVEVVVVTLSTVPGCFEGDIACYIDYLTIFAVVRIMRAGHAYWDIELLF